MSEWISVKDRLPEEDGSYLVYEAKYFGTGVYIGWFNNKKQYFTDEESSNVQNVDYWMPMPEPPKGE